MSVRAKARELRWRAAGHLTRPLDDAFSAPLADGHVLELGGPSAVFGDGGLLPVYGPAAGVDNVQFAARTAWHDLTDAEAFAPGGTAIGRQLVLDDPELTGVADDTYDAVMSSHVIEHLANPLRAIGTWQRIVRPGGHLLLVAPHKDGTFDHRRPTTRLEHLIADAEAGVGEDDLTHLEETLTLHDLARDVPDVDRAEWEAARRDNHATRLIHHHTFTTPSLLALLDHAGLTLLRAEARFPHDIYVLARFPDASVARPDNAAFLAASRPSPFPSDR